MRQCQVVSELTNRSATGIYTGRMDLRPAAFLFAFAALPLAAQPAAPASTCNNTPAYSPCEMTFELSGTDGAAHPNPYADVDLRVEFRSPRHRTHSIPAFWDGGKRLVIRFSPTEGGNWDYHVTSNIAGWNDMTGSFTAASSESKGFIHPANKHHWAYSEKDSRGLYQPHLWMGASEPLFATMDDTAFQAMASARSSQKFSHLRGFILSAGQPGAYTSSDQPVVSYFQRLDQRVRDLNQKGMIVDLILAGGPGYLVKAFPTRQQRTNYLRFVVGRYAAYNVTWQGVDYFEDYTDARALLKELGTQLKQFDPYQHPRTAGARLTSSPMVDDGWMDFAACATPDNNLGAIEHQLYPVPFVNTDFGREDTGGGKSGPGDVDSTTFRHLLWNATMNGEDPTYASTGGGGNLNSAGAKAMSVWFDFFSDTRYWELEPYFDVDGGRAVALEDTEYVVYIEKPGPIELTVEKHGYDLYWINPADGESIRKKFSGEHFTGEPPDRSHDWILHVVREGHLASMNRSFKFGSRETEQNPSGEIQMQEVEANTPKVPFVIEQPTGDLSLSKPTPFAAKLTKETRATRSMYWLWMGEVAADHQGYRVLATGQKGTMQPPRGIATYFPALMHLRLYGMNANGKVYEIDAACQINQ